MSTTSGSDEISNLLSQLPRQHWFEQDIYQWCGHWYPVEILEGILAARSHFKARDEDIIISSPMKTGTTWLKSLVPAIMQRPQDDDVDFLTQKNPHAIVETLEYVTYGQGRIPDLSSMPSPRIFHTHLPYHSIPDSIKEFNCKVVYIARNPKDVFVSLWHFENAGRTPEQGPYPIDKAFESFCNGVEPCGPYFDHVLGYWNQSLICPKNMMFLKYEDLKRNPEEEVKKLACFLGKPLVTNEEVGNVVRRCSFGRLQNLEVNKNGREQSGWPHKSWFRKGDVGDSKNFFTDEMEERVDQIVQSKFQGTGLIL